VPFATAWDQATAYCRRRLQSNPDMAVYVARNLLSMLRGRRPGLAQYVGDAVAPLARESREIDPSAGAPRSEEKIGR
jgi:hypothetical protein